MHSRIRFGSRENSRQAWSVQRGSFRPLAGRRVLCIMRNRRRSLPFVTVKGNEPTGEIEMESVGKSIRKQNWHESSLGPEGGEEPLHRDLVEDAITEIYALWQAGTVNQRQSRPGFGPYTTKEKYLHTVRNAVKDLISLSSLLVFVSSSSTKKE